MRNVVREDELRAMPDARRLPGAPGWLSCLVDLGMPCNLACAGCPDRRRRAAFAGDESHALGAQLVRRAREGAARRLDVAFFGGEPLLDAEVVTRLSGGIRDGCAADGIAYRGIVVTNGTVLAAVGPRPLVDAGLDRVQITLEGPAARHDAVRRTRTGEGTFRRILDNLHAARAGLDVVVRTSARGRDLQRLVAILDREGLFAPPSPVAIFAAPPAPYPAQVRDLFKLFPLLDALRPGGAEPPLVLH
jgi:sulfatase maturation enzyme AslB (radical SAM superfamily)